MLGKVIAITSACFALVGMGWTQPITNGEMLKTTMVFEDQLFHRDQVFICRERHHCAIGPREWLRYVQTTHYVHVVSLDLQSGRIEYLTRAPDGAQMTIVHE